MGDRAVQLRATRERIVEAAIELYTELGVSATTMRQVGIRADVAPGTLRNHFRSREELDAAVVERLTAEAPLPDRSIFDGATTIEDRLGRLLQAAGVFLERSARLYRMWLRERMVTGVWAKAGAAYGERWDELIRLALGPLANDADAAALLRAVLDPTFFGNVRAGTRTPEAAAHLITAAFAAWFATRERSSPGS